MRRSATSIPSNIAEGCRGSNKELVHFLNISLGSSFELETQLILVKRLYSENEIKINLLIEQLNILQKRLNAYRTFIKGKMT